MFRIDISVILSLAEMFRKLAVTGLSLRFGDLDGGHAFLKPANQENPSVQTEPNHFPAVTVHITMTRVIK